MQDHLASMIPDHGVRVGGGIIKKLVAFGSGEGCRASLLGGYFIERWQHGRIHCPGVVEEGSVDRLDALSAEFV